MNCINSILDSTVYENWKLYIADTGSTDDELDKLQIFLLDRFHDKKNCELLRYDYYNFGKINNDVVKNRIDTDTDYVLFCNDDIELLNDAISYMVKAHHLHKPDVGTVGCRLVFEDSRIQHAGMFLFSWKHEDGTMSDVRVTHRGYQTSLQFEQDGPEEVVGNTCGFCMVPYDLFLDMGGFNENYMYCFEDVEFNIECIMRGKKNLYLDYAKCVHYESVSRKREHGDDNVEETIRQNFDFNKSLKPYLDKTVDKLGKYIHVLDSNTAGEHELV